MRNKISKINI